MNKSQKHIQTLIAEACRHPVGSAIRQKRLTQIIRLVSGQLWKENVSYYQDALQKTWIYFCQNLCADDNAKCPYNPDKGSLVTWLNTYLKWRLKDGYIKNIEDNVNRVSNQPKPKGNTASQPDLIDNLPAKPDIPPILTEVMQWAETAPKLQQIHITDHPNITGRLLILKRLPPEIPWKVLAKELDVSIGTLASFYQRQCMPLLRDFGREQGYL